MTIGRKIKKYREDNNLSQTEFLALLWKGKDYHYLPAGLVEEWESGGTVPTKSNKIAIYNLIHQPPNGSIMTTTNIDTESLICDPEYKDEALDLLNKTRKSSLDDQPKYDQLILSRRGWIIIKRIEKEWDCEEGLRISEVCSYRYYTELPIPVIRLISKDFSVSTTLSPEDTKRLIDVLTSS